MGSAQKTDFLSLNKWISTDIPKREDFNYDNLAIDNAFKEHLADMSKHISEEERSEWNSPHYIGFYYGIGSSAERTIETGCSFVPGFAIVFAGNSPPVVTNTASALKYRFGFASKRVGVPGFSLSGKNLVVKSGLADGGTNAAMEFDIAGATYCYILFR